MPPDRPRPRPGRQPYDSLNGLRVGALAGGLLGAVATRTMAGLGIWPVVAGAVLGGAAGFWSERGRLRR